MEKSKKTLWSQVIRVMNLPKTLKLCFISLLEITLLCISHDTVTLKNNCLMDLQ